MCRHYVGTRKLGQLWWRGDTGPRWMRVAAVVTGALGYNTRNPTENEGARRQEGRLEMRIKDVDTRHDLG